MIKGIRAHHVGGALLAPVLVTQGIVTRISVPKLPEPTCPRSGTAGRGPRLRLLVLGDSAAAGVGASNQTDALIGQILATLTDVYTVQWRVEAATGATTSDTLERLQALPRETFDIAVPSLGVNDVTGGTRLRTWLEQQTKLVSLLQQRFDVQRVILSALPPVYAFPALPQPLRWFLGSRTLYFDRALEALSGRLQGCSHVRPKFAPDLTMMASDGFHPGPRIYRVWGTAVAEQILKTSFSQTGGASGPVKVDP